MSDAIIPGTRIGSYEVVAPIGAGGMGEVHRARDTKLNRDVAIKVLPDLFSQDPDRLARFQREAQVLAALNHPNIAQIYGLEDRALVMEFVDGEDLAQRLERGALPLDEAVAIGAQIADALETAHEQGIIHRDLKPANVKVRPDGTVKVLDFGLAKAMDPAASVATSATMSPTLTARATQLGTIIGTAAYMSPEQAKGKAVDRRADIWAFGVVLYEMLAGRRAFKGEDVSDTLAAVLRQDVELSALPARTPRSVRTLISRCLVRDPRQRLRDIGEARVLLAQLKAGAVDEDTPAATTSAAPVVAARPLWRRALLPLACAIVAAGAAGYGAWVLKPGAPRPVTRFVVTLPEGQTFSNPGRKSIALSPDGTRLAYVANRQIFVRSLAGFETHAIPGGESPVGGIHYIAFSPNGQEIAYRNVVDGMLKRIPVAGGAPVTISAIPIPWGLSWTEHGIFFGVAGKGILRVSANGGTPELVAGVGADEAADAPDVLPGGEAVLFSVKKNSETWDKARVVVQRLRDGVRKTVIDGGADATYVETGHVVYALAGILFAVPFDLDSLSVAGSPFSVVEGVRRAGMGPTATATAQYALSRSGTLAYMPGPASVNRAGDSALVIVDRKGPARPLKLPQANYSAPRVSPDGKFVVFERENETEADVWIYEMSEATAMRRLTFGGKNRAPVWSGDSQWVAFQSDREGDAAIYRQRADGSAAAERLTKAESGVRHIPQSWSPDSRYLLYTEERPEKQSLWLLTVSDRRVAPFMVIESAPQLEAAFSPDGKWVAYSAREVGPTARNTFVVPFPPTGAKYLVPVNGGHAFWFRKGDALHLNTGPSQGAIVSVRTAPQFGFGQPDTYVREHSEPSPSLSRRNVDALPDGTILGVMSRLDPASSASDSGVRINVVLSWTEELRARVK